MEFEDNFLPNPYHVSFGIQDDVVRGNIFRPVQPYSYVTPKVEMIIPPIIWIGYEIFIIKEKLMPKEGDCLFLNPNHGEFTQALLWKLYGNTDYVIGRDWASTREKEWLFNSEMKGRQRSWPGDISSMINLIFSHKEIQDEEIKSYVYSIMGSRFIRIFEEKTRMIFNEMIENELLPILKKVKKSSIKEEVKKDLVKAFITFINICFLKIRNELKKEYYHKKLPKRFNKFFQTNIVNDEYSVDNFLQEIFGINPDDPGSLNELKKLGEIVHRLSSPIFSPKEIDLFFSSLNNTKTGRILLISFIILDYASKLISDDCGISNQLNAIDKLYDNKTLILYLEKILNLGDSHFQKYLDGLKNIPVKNIKNPITFKEIEKYIYYWLMNLFLYFGEIIIRNDIDRKKLVDIGFSEKNIARILKIEDFKQSFLKKYLSNHYPNTLLYLENFASEIQEIKRDNFQHLYDFIQILKNELGKNKNLAQIFLHLIKTNKSFEYLGARLIPNPEAKIRFSKISTSVVFPGREGSVGWYYELVQMRLKGYE